MGATKSAVLAAARRRYGKKVTLREDRGAPTPAQREKLIAARKVKHERKMECQRLASNDERIGSLNDLIKAAQFVVDVNGDHPSIEQLASALARAITYRDARDEYSALSKEMMNSGGIGRFRWEICGLMAGRLVSADGWRVCGGESMIGAWTEWRRWRAAGCRD